MSAAAVMPLWSAAAERSLRRWAARRRRRCGHCRRRITDAISLRYRLGSGCRRKLGIGRRLQLGRAPQVRDPGHIPGRLDLLSPALERTIE